ncbi:neuronal PAS domain-containing protein 4B [Aplysia californica]|uniref:Neuronal PAS domain-containing protein 4B n=1 Tax=Aplysia californica TaxID=6500 RepID=A0ABM0K0Y6_APLCA|nr:neuronal PAS domain-containing protein 4B [Aplysia californica]
MAPVEEVALLDFDRSNKGASKQRRDQINAEIATMRDLLPLPESSRQRLSQLQIMSLTCVYIRKCNVLQKLFRSKSQDSPLPESLDFFQALTGFLLVTTREGKLLYISENVTDFLGHSMVDMKTQGDSLYDIVDKRDQDTVQAQLMAAGQPDPCDPDDVSFFCRMNMSRTLKRQSGFGDVKVMHVRGHFIRVSEPGSPVDGQCVFMATCSPLITPELKENLVQNNTMVFKTVHQLDMTVMEVTKTAEFHLGRSSEELTKQSWYAMLHPEDIHEAKEKHVQLIRSNHEMGSMMTVRMLRGDGTPFWVNIVMHVRQASLSQSDEPLIVCVNQVIDGQEAYQIKVQSHMFSMYPSRAHELWSSQLSSVTSSPDMAMGHWVQQNGSASVPVPGYQASMPGCMTPHGRPSIYHVQCPPGMTMSQGNKSVVGLPSPTFNAASAMVQSDRLKAMLKRKIQGPQSASCRPNKMAKTSWSMDDCSRGQGYSDVNSRNVPLMEHYGQVPMAMCLEGQGQSMQVLQPSNYRMGVLTARKSPEVLACQAMVAPSLSKVGGHMSASEQVVPDVNVPDSFLTPDPSPISSPQPSSNVSIKTEVMDPEEAAAQNKNSTSILQALEKLAALTQDAKKTEKVAAVPSPPRASLTQSARPDTTSVSQRRKELPIFDAFEIETFFDTLDIPELKPKASAKMEIKTEIKQEFPTEKMCPGNIPNILALKEEQCTVPVYKASSSPQHGSPAAAAAATTGTGSESRFQSPFPFQSPCEMIVPGEMTGGHSSQAAVRSPVISSSPSPGSPSSDLHGSQGSMAGSPQSSVASPEGSFQDLLSCFSDDGLDLSPLQMDPRSNILDSSVSEDLLDDPAETSFLSAFYTNTSPDFDKSSNRGGQKLGSPGLPEELSPHSTSSLLAGEEEEAMGEGSDFTLAMALESLGSDDEACATSLKARDVLGMSDELKQLDLLLGAF